MGNECSACNKDSQSKEQEIYLIKTHMRNDRKENLERVKSETKFFTVKEIINQNPEMYNKLQKIKSYLIGYKERKCYQAILKKYRESELYFKFEELYETIQHGTKFSNEKRYQLYTYKTKAVYDGEWLGGFRHFHGKMTWPNGVEYEGEWAFGFAEGQGKITYPNGDYMEGFFRYNKLNGEGKLHNADTGYDYIGNWENDQQSGKGKETWPDGSSYEGSYELGKKEGVGIYKWIDGTYYVGEWKDNKIHGLGIYDWSDGRRYIGEWKNSKMNGKGVFLWKDGRQYVGEYKDDKKNGFGIFLLDARNKKYEGFWENGVRSKLGKYTKEDKSYQLGNWSDNQLKDKITDENEVGNKLAEIDNYITETNASVDIVIESIKILFKNQMPDFNVEQLLGSY